jgi:Cd2+/Zn2+-exporting ATPase
MQDDLAKIPYAIGVAQSTLGVVRQNVAFCLGIKGLALFLGAIGVTGLWFSVFADVGVAALAILNSMRTLRVK